ncbi:uncharacterized protein LOC134260015 [Saccostrea cucullata]|uniref:uncharacterized protein LOC134260015 n=1 Tax=Saccostrea cuccullata TaxID=36930 RepID=UPI002ED51533
MPRFVIKGTNGTSFTLVCDEHVKNQLLSPDIDPALKDMVVKMLIENQKPVPQFQRPPPPAPPPSSQSEETDFPSTSESAHSTSESVPSTPESAPSTSESVPGYVHVWKDKEEDMLVHLRHERQDLFLKTRNHGILWQEISNELSKVFKTKISCTQALNKYNNLKKRWKEIIDAGTGTERKDFRLKEEFDLVFGTKPSAKPCTTLDSSSLITSDDPSPEESPSKSTRSSRKIHPKRVKNLPQKRKLQTSKVLEDLSNSEKEFNSKIEKFHNEKMARMDRFLDLFERSLEKK